MGIVAVLGITSLRYQWNNKFMMLTTTTSYMNPSERLTTTTTTASMNLIDLVASTAAASTTHVPPERHPFWNLEPLTHSLHPRWKLWTEMDAEQQQVALDEVGTYLRKYGTLIMARGRNVKIKHGSCDLKVFKNGHALCGPPPPSSSDCFFISFGINDDPSFDVDLATDWNCSGFAGDPTVPHPSKLHPRVTFHNVGASIISANEERLIHKGGTEDWITTSMPKLRYWLGRKHIDILKLDCEGCEVAFARDILREDPEFLFAVDQLSIETHVSKTWIRTQEELYYFGLHFALLEEAGFQLEWSDVFGCSKRHEITGCLPEIEEKYGYPCGYSDWKDHPKVVLGRSCQDFLWKRYPSSSSSQSMST
jgi:hypothetical protein